MLPRLLIALMMLSFSRLLALDISIDGIENADIQIICERNGAQISLVLEKNGGIYYLDKNFSRIELSRGKEEAERSRAQILSIVSHLNISDRGTAGPGFKMVMVTIGAASAGFTISYGWNPKNGETIPVSAAEIIRVVESMLSDSDK